MNLRDLRYLLAVAEHEHFGRAARACGVGQPTLSVQIRKLEDLMGVTLFERSSKPAAPTEGLPAAARPRPRGGQRRRGHPGHGAEPARPAVGTLPAGHHPDPGALSAAAGLRAAAPRPCRRWSWNPWEDQTSAPAGAAARPELDAAPAGHRRGRAGPGQPAAVRRAVPGRPAPRAPAGGRSVIRETDLARDILVLADGHCLRDQTVEACGGDAALGGRCGRPACRRC